MGGTLHENKVLEVTFNAIQPLPILDELDADPTVDNLRKTIDDLEPGKAPGKDRIAQEVIKCAIDMLVNDPYLQFHWYWKEGTMSHDMKDSDIINQ